jgi:hypothetical protein
MKNFLKFIREDFWSWFNALPKCKKGGYCNTKNREHYAKKIITEDASTFVYGYYYYCSKCGNKIGVS